MATLDEALTLAFQHHQAGRLELAEDLYRRILAAEPQQADAWHLWGLIAQQTGRLAAAVDRIRHAIALSPTAAAYHNNLGNVLLAQGAVDEAVACFQRALELNPHYAKAHHNLGNAYKEQGRLGAAMSCYREALDLEPNTAEIHNSLGIALQALGELNEAVACYERALELNPNYSRAQTNLGTVRMTQGRLSEAIDRCRRAVEPDPNYAAGQVNLGSVLLAQGELEEALACYRRALDLQPDAPVFHSNVLLTLQYRPGITLRELAAAFAEFDRRHVAPLKAGWRPHPNTRVVDRPLRLGFISADFRRHPVGGFYLRPQECLHAAEAEIFNYFTGVQPDEVTGRFRAAAHTWRDVPGVSDAALAEQIRADQIDILFDLATHAEGNRLMTFARKPAPIQIAWAGPTGVSAIDYLLADANLVPPGVEDDYTEQLLRMPDAYICYAPPTATPDVTPLPALQHEQFTFGSPHNLAKITPQVIETWAEILRRVPNSRLLLWYAATTQDPGTQERLRERFAAAGIGAERLGWGGWRPYVYRLEMYHHIDLVLDTFPFSGCTTTCEALWMGVPVITCPGETYMSRQSLSIVRTVGLDDAVADGLPDYIDRAVRWASDPPRLAAIRADLRTQMTNSPLCDGPRFATNLTTLLRDVWRRWCAG
jgi:protein O-GlcNAc transferase